MKNRGPIIEPCGMPQICHKASDIGFTIDNLDKLFFIIYLIVFYYLFNYCTKIFVIIVNTCVCRRSVDNKALILSYPYENSQLSIDELSR